LCFMFFFGVLIEGVVLDFVNAVIDWVERDDVVGVFVHEVGFWCGVGW
jgi:hypothetical protein